jgi:hypothetical protein
MPNPQSGSGISLMIWTAGPVSSLSLKIYGKAMMFVAEKELEPGNAGWQFYRIEDLSLGNGVYYLVASAVGENGKKLKSKPTKMLILR